MTETRLNGPIDAAAVSPTVPGQSGKATAGLARFAADLPPVSEFITLGECDTPLLPLPRLAARLGLQRLSAKLESCNPTGSYKDRVAAMSISLALHRGQRGWVATSSGNAGVALAAYGARAGLSGFLCLVATAPAEKRAALLPYGIQLLPVAGVGEHGDGTAAVTLLEQVVAAAGRHDLFLAVTAHAFNPEGMRGIDTLGYELVEQAPDLTHLYLPTGGGGLLTAVARGLRNRGHLARLVCCQADGCAPIVGFLQGTVPTPQIDDCRSGISALQLPFPPDGELAAAAVHASSGWGTSVTDADILTAQRLLGTLEGVFVEPAAAATLAALIRDVDEDRIQRNDHPVLVLSGSGGKDLSRFTTPLDPTSVRPASEAAAAIDNWVTHLAPPTPTGPGSPRVGAL